MPTTIRSTLLTLLALALLAAAESTLAAPSTHTAGLVMTVHGTQQLELSSCVYPDENDGALFLAFMDNPSGEPVKNYTVTLHGAGGALLAERTYSALQPGESDVFAVRIASTQARALSTDDSPRCADAR